MLVKAEFIILVPIVEKRTLTIALSYMQKLIAKFVAKRKTRERLDRFG